MHNTRSDPSFRVLEDCKRSGDEEGVRTYRTNLAVLDAHAAGPELIDAEIEVLETLSNAQRLTDLLQFQTSNEVLARLLAVTGDTAAIVQGLQPHILGRMASTSSCAETGFVPAI